MKTFFFYFVLLLVTGLVGHVVYHIIKKRRLEVNDSFAIIAILIGVLALPSLNESMENSSPVTKAEQKIDTASVAKPKIAVVDSPATKPPMAPQVEVKKEEKKRRVLPQEVPEVVVDSAQIRFHMPELIKSSWCNDPGGGIIERDSLQVGVIKLTSIGAKGRMVGLYDPVTKRSLHYTLYINRNDYGELDFDKMSKSSIFDSEQELQFWVLRGRYVKFEDFAFDIVYTDALGNRYVQRATPRISFDCVVHDVSKPKLTK